MLPFRIYLAIDPQERTNRDGLQSYRPGTKINVVGIRRQGEAQNLPLGLSQDNDVEDGTTEYIQTNDTQRKDELMLLVDRLSDSKGKFSLQDIESIAC